MPKAEQVHRPIPQAIEVIAAPIPPAGIGERFLREFLWSDGQIQMGPLAALSEVVPEHLRRGFAGDMRDMVRKHFTGRSGIDIGGATNAILECIREACRHECCKH